jgi:Trypsin
MTPGLLLIPVVAAQELNEVARERCKTWMATVGLSDTTTPPYRCLTGGAELPGLPMPAPADEDPCLKPRSWAEARDPLGVAVCMDSVVRILREDGATCTGAVVAPGIVLTAGHCTPAVEVQFGYDTPYQVAVEVLGSIQPHDRRVDLALLRVPTLTEAFPIPWRLPGESVAPEPQRKLVGIGYGVFKSEGADPKVRNGAELEVDDGWGCNINNRRYLGCRPGQELFAYGTTFPQDSCSGDSGAPILEYVVEPGAPKDSTEVSMWQIVGVVSRATAGASDACGEGTIATRIDAQAAWMIESIQVLDKRFPISE